MMPHGHKGLKKSKHKGHKKFKMGFKAFKMKVPKFKAFKMKAPKFKWFK